MSSNYALLSLILVLSGVLVAERAVQAQGDRRSDPEILALDTDSANVRYRNLIVEDTREWGRIRWCRVGQFKNRRFSAVAMQPRTLLMQAYWSDIRPDYRGRRPADETYTVDLIIPEAGGRPALREQLQQSLTLGLDINAERETRQLTVGVVTRDSTRALGLQENSDEGTSFRPGESKVEGTAAPAEMLTRLLSAALKTPVYNETGLEKKYDFTVEWTKGDRGSLEDALRDLGLRITWEERPEEVLVVRSHE